MCAQLDPAVERSGRRQAARPDWSGRLDLKHVERGRRADGDGPRHGLDGQHEPGPAVRGWPADAKSLALADGESVGAVVPADHGAVGLDDLARDVAQPALQEAPGVAVSDEADVMAVWLVGDPEAPAGGLLAYLLLRRVPERKHGAAQLVARQHAEHVRLILGRV